VREQQRRFGVVGSQRHLNGLGCVSLPAGHGAPAVVAAALPQAPCGQEQAREEGVVSVGLPRLAHVIAVTVMTVVTTVIMCVVM